MKYLVSLFFVLQVVAQEIKIERPNLEMIKKEIQKKDSEFFYPKLLEKLKNKDVTLTKEHYKHLYFGRFFQTDFSPYSHSKYEKEMGAFFSAENLEAKDYPAVIDLFTKELKENPFNLRAMNFLAYIYHLNGNKTESQNVSTIFQNFIEVIYLSGDGKTCEIPINKQFAYANTDD